MERQSFLAKLEFLPLGVVPAAMGLAALSNIWGSLGFHWVNTLSMLLAGLTWLLYLSKVVFHWKTCVREYQNIYLAAIYCTLSILLMLFTAWLARWFFMPAKILHLLGVTAHLTFIGLFTLRYLRRWREPDAFVPNWYVTYGGILISPAVGGIFNVPLLHTLIFWFGLIVYWASLPFMAARLWRWPVPEVVLHTRLIMLAPPAISLYCPRVRTQRSRLSPE